MANTKVTGVDRQRPYIGPHGNVSVAREKFEVPAAFGDGDTFDILRLPRGAAIIDCIVIHDAMATSVTLDLGLIGITGGSTVKEGIDVLIDGGDVAAAGILRRTEVGIFTDSDLTLDDDYYVRVELNGANPDAGGIEVLIMYEYLGTK